MSQSPNRRVGRTKFIEIENLNSKYKDELFALEANLKAIHGEGTAQHLKFIVNLEGLTSLFLKNSTPDDGIDLDEFSTMANDLANHLANSHAAALNLTAEQQKAAYATSRLVDRIIDMMMADKGAKQP